MIPHKVCNNLCISHSSTPPHSNPPPPQKKKSHSDLLRPINSFSSLLIETLTLGNLMSLTNGRRSRVQCRGQGSNVAAGESDLGFEVTEWKRLIWKKYKREKKIVFMHDTLRAWLKVRDGRGTKKEKTGCRPRFSRLAASPPNARARVHSPH